MEAYSVQLGTWAAFLVDKSSSPILSSRGKPQLTTLEYPSHDSQSLEGKTDQGQSYNLQFFKDIRPHPDKQIIDGELLQTLHYEILGEFQNFKPTRIASCQRKANTVGLLCLRGNVHIDNVQYTQYVL